jgi:GTPase SAR1 family protein
MNMAYNSYKNECLISALQRVAIFVGEKKSVDGQEIGLGLSLQHDYLMKQVQDIHDGIFRVVVMGAFTTGKSTLINALVGKRILPESALPSTAILTFIQYGEDEDSVEVHFKDMTDEDGNHTVGRLEKMSQEDFFREYRYTNEDNREFIETGQVDRFAIVDYAIMRCSLDLMHNGVCIVDSPGLEDKAVATELSLSMAKQAQAIVYVCSERGFDDRDRSYFEEHFLGCPRNVFFVMNRIDIIASQVERTIALEKMKDDVKVCFLRNDGTIDYELMNSRVFGLSSLDALDARRGMTFDADLQLDITINEYQCTEKEQKSNIQPFEKELERFLTTDEMCKALYGKSFVTLYETYQEALRKTRESMDFYEGNKQMTEGNRKECERIIAEIETNINATEQAFNACVIRLQSLFGDLVRDSIHSVDKTWHVDLPKLQEEISFGMGQYLRLALTNINIFISAKEREENTKKLLEPFAQIIAKHISDKIDEYVEDNRSVVNAAIMECQSKVDTSLQQTAQLFGELGDSLTDETEFAVGGDQNWLQNIVSTIMGDASAAVKTAAGGKMAWMEFVSKAVFNFTWQWVIGVMASGGWGLFIIALIEYMQMRNGRHEMVERMLTECKTKTLNEMDSKLSTSIEVMNQRIAGMLYQVREDKCRSIRQQLADEREHLAEIQANLDDNNFNAETERQRTDHILTTVLKESAHAYSEVFDQQVSTEEFLYLMKTKSV